MQGEFYTERDIADLVRSGQRELHLSPQDRMTDLARERAAKEGLKITGAYRIPEQAAREAASTRYAEVKPEDHSGERSRPSPEREQLRSRIRRGVIAKLGSSVDNDMLDDVIDRVLTQLGE